jgi:hypothetical protein
VREKRELLSDLPSVIPPIEIRRAGVPLQWAPAKLTLSDMVRTVLRQETWQHAPERQRWVLTKRWRGPTAVPSRSYAATASPEPATVANLRIWPGIPATYTGGTLDRPNRRLCPLTLGA